MEKIVAKLRFPSREWQKQRRAALEDGPSIVSCGSRNRLSGQAARISETGTIQFAHLTGRRS
ncbi:MAG TPA: hypothetical protein VIM02_07955 [Rhizomicrobium sp.]